MDLRHGDCLEVMKEFEEDSIDLLFADLPYGQTSCAWDSLVDLDLFWKEANRVCKPDAPMVFTCTVKFGNTLINSNPKNFRYDLIWVKTTLCGFLTAKKMPMKKHEMIYVFYRKLPKVYTENIALHHTHKFLKQTENKRKVGGKGCYINGSKTETCSKYDPPLPKSILEVKSEKGKHATQKPVALMEWILKYYSSEGGVVLDPTMGSGSMGVACGNQNRLFIGIEKDETIYNVALERCGL